ncbi:MAG: glycosyltransferase [Sphingobacteriales bacterium]|nr:MAG: glycosyltransferase [Sphingobacteriales bacterium]
MSETKTRILFVRPTLGYGGADRITVNLLRDFDRSRYTCDLVLMRKEGEFAGDIPADVRIIETRSANALLMFRALIPLIGSGAYDVVYSTSGGTNVPLMLATFLSAQKPVTVLSERSALFAPGKNRLKQRFFHWMKKLTYPAADHITAVSAGLQKELLQELNIDPGKLRLVNNPVINDELLGAREEKLQNIVFQQQEPVILAAGRFIPLKDYETLFKAFQLVNTKRKSRLYLLGKGPLEKKLRTLAITLGLADRIHFGGFDKNPFRYMSRCSVFVLSSRHEGMPGVLIQAMACGAPCVATNCPTGPDEIIKDGENGFLVPVGDAAAMADRMLRILNDPLLREKFSKAATASLARFEHRAAIESYFNFLHSS